MRRAWTMTSVLAVAVATFGVALWARQELPEGPGQATTQKLCASNCHGAERLIAEHRSKSQWLETIETMKHEGAKGTDEEFKATISYLIAKFGIQTKINKATARQIDDALELEPGQAEAIVKYREANGPFADFDALLKVPGLDAKKLTEQKANIAF